MNYGSLAAETSNVLFAGPESRTHMTPGSQLSERERERNRVSLRVNVDGPFGAPVNRALSEMHVIAVGGGIGVTPFISLLRSCLAKKPPRLVHLLFVWVCRDATSYEFFLEELVALPARLASQGTWPWLVGVRIYFTADKQPAETMLYTKRVEGTLIEIRFGRPAWGELLTESASLMASPSLTSVFVCGPQAIYTQLRRAADVTSSGKFVIHKERF
jgi:NADPH oxidase